MSSRTLFASAGVLATALAIPVLLEAQDILDPTRDPMVRTVIVRSECPETVFIFFGQSLPLHPQDITTLGPYMQSAESLLPGDIVWLVDVAGEEIDRAVVELDMVAITVDPSCLRLFPSRAQW